MPFFFLEALLKGDKNTVFADSRLEKEVRGRLKSEVIRLLSKETVIICDGLNYIKGTNSYLPVIYKLEV
jgi:protein KTI12